MSLIKETEKYLEEVITNLGYPVTNLKLETCKMPEYGEYQLNIAMQLAKEAQQNPRDIASKIVSALDSRFTKVNIQGPGFINLSFTDDVLLDYANASLNDFAHLLDKSSKARTVVLDYGGANIAKELHVGHLRCNIGEAIRRLLKLVGDNPISDIHWGDWGTPIGLVIREIQELYPDLPYFDPNYAGEYPKEPPVSVQDLAEIYPRASARKSVDEVYANEARVLTRRFQQGDKGILALWKHICDISAADCLKIYDYLNCHFDYLYGESNANPYVNAVLDLLNKQHLTKTSDGALIMPIAEASDNKEMPPLILLKSDGAVLYHTTELATIYQRMQDWHPDAIWYFADDRQSLHFEQVFRAAYLSGLVSPDVDLRFCGFGTINDSNGKPFKTRDGASVSLRKLIAMVYEAIEPQIKSEIVGEERQSIANKLAVATLKYADLLPYRKTDYNFDIDKFSSFEGKTGIYAVYTTTRIKSLLKKIGGPTAKMHNIPNAYVHDILLKITELSRVINSALQEVSTSYLCDYIYDLCSLFNKFYTNINIMNEQNPTNKETYLALTHLVYNILHELLQVLAIDEVERM